MESEQQNLTSEDIASLADIFDLLARFDTEQKQNALQSGEKNLGDTLG